MLAKINPTTTQSWAKLQEHRQTWQSTHLNNCFKEQPNRFDDFTLKFDDFLFDFSKNKINTTTLSILKELFEECEVPQSIQKQFSGKAINETENRAVLHTALRNFSGRPVMVDGQDVMPAVQNVLKQMKRFSEAVISGESRGYSQKPIIDIVNIGIGGSDLGPVMVYEALKPYRVKHINCHFVSNVDGADIAETLEGLNTETTLFVIASKTFTTQETMTNAHTARTWFLENGGNEKAIAQHFAAVSTNAQAVVNFGIDSENMFEFWDWVGGRYSVWSAIGLSLCLGLGYDVFEQFLKGAHQMDEHFSSSPFEKNIPMQMAAIGIWYNNFWDAHTEAIIPYYQNMHRFAAYFQQGNMESNGKSVDRSQQKIDYQTGPIVWGEPGTNGQHAFFQLIHQGTRTIPCDFIGFSQSPYKLPGHHAKFMANFFAQTEALMKGKTKHTAEIELIENNGDKVLAAYKEFEGNKPTTTILGKMPTPESIGQLVACYEHKIFCQGVVWNIYSFDQWGVELGKQLASQILPKLQNSDSLDSHDSSTNGLISFFRENS